MREQKGITLVALIITIIVLLILAVVAIAAVTDAGMFEKANQAATIYNEKAAEENGVIGNYAVNIQAYIEKVPTDN